jgi:hypothetical protein
MMSFIGSKIKDMLSGEMVSTPQKSDSGFATNPHDVLVSNLTNGGLRDASEESGQEDGRISAQFGMS